MKRITYYLICLVVVTCLLKFPAKINAGKVNAQKPTTITYNGNAAYLAGATFKFLLKDSNQVLIKSQPAKLLEEYSSWILRVYNLDTDQYITLFSGLGNITGDAVADSSTNSSGEYEDNVRFKTPAEVENAAILVAKSIKLKLDVNGHKYNRIETPDGTRHQVNEINQNQQYSFNAVYYPTTNTATVGSGYDITP